MKFFFQFLSAIGQAWVVAAKQLPEIIRKDVFDRMYLTGNAFILNEVTNVCIDKQVCREEPLSIWLILCNHVFGMTRDWNQFE